MTTTGEPTTRTAPPSDPAAGAAATEGPGTTRGPGPGCPISAEGRRFIEDIVHLHGRLTFGGLPHAIKGTPLFLSEDFGDGLTTVTTLESQIPSRYMKGILGFRLAQYLRLGWISDELVYRRALFHEPSGTPRAVENLHTVTLDADSGRIVGYIGLVCSLDAEPRPLDSPYRSRFPSESAHHVDLVSRFAAPDITSHQVYEVKRFVREMDMERGDQRWRVPWHLILGLGSAVVAAGDRVRLILGDSKENGALRHFRAIGFDPVVVESTEPSLSRSELMWPSYTQKVNAKPFAGLVPDDFSASMEAIRGGLAEGREHKERDLAVRLSAQRRASASARSARA